MTLRFAGGEDVTADRVILAVPPAPARRDRSRRTALGRWQAFAGEVRLGANEKLNAVYRSKPWTATPMGIDGATWDLERERAFSEVWECTGGQRPRKACSRGISAASRSKA